MFLSNPLGLTRLYVVNMKSSHNIYDGGGLKGLRYCDIELFFKRFFGNLDYYGIIQPCGMRFFILLNNGIR